MGEIVAVVTLDRLCLFAAFEVSLCLDALVSGDGIPMALFAAALVLRLRVRGGAIPLLLVIRERFQTSEPSCIVM